MSAILTILGRPTKDPEMQQGRNSGAEYVTLDIGTSQRGQDGKEESSFYQGYFNKFLAERLLKAGVKKGTVLMFYGDLELHPFIYQQWKMQESQVQDPESENAELRRYACWIVI